MSFTVKLAKPLAVGAMLVAVASGPVAATNDLPVGTIIEMVECLDDPKQTYALYVPSSYSPERPATLLVGFQYQGFGRTIVATYRAAAERYGYIVAGSNNSRNGRWDLSAQAAEAVFTDLGKRFVINPNRIYLTGHSGGARMALQIALSNKHIAGVIASGAGFIDQQPRSSLHFPLYSTAGADDFNYIEMRMLDHALKTPHRLVIHHGGHTMPPEEVAMDAVEWMEAQAMASGLRPRDEELIDRLWQDRMAGVAAAGETAGAVHRLRAMAANFKGLRDVTDVEARAAALAKRKDIKRVLDLERENDQAEVDLLAEVAAREAGLRDEARREESLAALRVLIANMFKRALSPVDSAERARSRRVLTATLRGAAMRAPDPDYLKLINRYRLPNPDLGRQAHRQS